MADCSLLEKVAHKTEIMSIKKFILPLLLVTLLTLSCSKEDDQNSDQVTSPPTSNTGEIDFIKTYGGTKNESAQSVTKTTDGGYAILGFTQSNDGDITDKSDVSYDYWVLKFNSASELQWRKTYGGTEDDRGRKIIQTQDDGYAILGSSFSNDGDVTGNAGQEDYWLAKLDALGNITWQKTFGYSGSDKGSSLIQTNEGGYLITGVLDVTASGGSGNSKSAQSMHAGGDYWAIKLNSNGNEEWRKYFGGNFSDTPNGVIQTEDNGYIIAGSSDSVDTDISGNIGSYDFWIIKISPSGILVWEKSFGGDQIDEARAIVSSGDGNYIIAGDTRSNDNDISNNIGAADLWLIKITPTGNLLWEKTYGGTNFDVARDIKNTQDGGFIISGSSRSNDGDLNVNQGQNDAWALKTNSKGNIQWQNSIGGTNIDFAYGIAELNDKSVVVVGDASSNDGDLNENKGFTDLLLIKIK